MLYYMILLPPLLLLLLLLCQLGLASAQHTVATPLMHSLQALSSC
jgi:cytochrome c oxidase subunit IV